MLILSALLAIIIGWLFGGRLSRFADAGLRFLWLPAAAEVLQRVYLRAWTLVLSYLILFIFLWFNRRMRNSVLLMGLGSLSNLIVIAANRFRMPVAAEAVSSLSPERAAALLAEKIPMYCSANAGTHLPFLGDVIMVRLPLVGGFASIGDVLLASGLFGMFMVVMSPPRISGMWLRGKHQN